LNENKKHLAGLEGDIKDLHRANDKLKGEIQNA